MDLETLFSEHDLIDKLSAELVALDHDTPESHHVASDRLSRLESLVASHLEKEDVSVYATIAKEQGRSAEAAEAIMCEFTALKCDWQNYLSHWTEARIASDWPDFQHDTAAMLGRLRARVREENQWLYPLALEHSVLRLRKQ